MRQIFARTDALRAGYLVTPEQVLLRFDLASIGARASALLIDASILVVAALGIVFLFSYLVENHGGWFAPIEVLLLFALRNFYFIYMEVRFSGQTLGKRLVGIRVVARDGGALGAGLVFARNLTRELEFIIPMALAVSGTAVSGVATWVVELAAILWIVVMLGIPLRTRSHARLGDLIAGTIVVQVPRPVLLSDLTDREVARPATSAGSAGSTESEGSAESTASAAPTGTASSDASLHSDGPVFTREQLDVYGIHELQVLEDVLRRPIGDVDYRLLDRLARTIQRKIGWNSAERYHSREFLTAFYAAQRGRLEKELAFGRRRERKRDEGDAQG